ncbi:hypothetical protein [Staphylococcus marylandisciuri]|uniref:hypothetical protein n=1 Tax=Staphylococcus marylandisciuri TaxID=2981529 RepID=UPI0021D3AD03|nr:hypothetical protein [Staphylococcus marylandisciuri]
MQVGVGPQQRETGKPVSPNTASWAGLRNLFIQIRFLSRSRTVSLSVDNHAYLDAVKRLPRAQKLYVSTSLFTKVPLR